MGMYVVDPGGGVEPLTQVMIKTWFENVVGLGVVHPATPKPTYGEVERVLHGLVLGPTNLVPVVSLLVYE